MNLVKALLRYYMHRCVPCLRCHLSGENRRCLKRRIIRDAAARQGRTQKQGAVVRGSPAGQSTKTRQAKLENGLTVLILEDHRTPSISVQLHISGAGAVLTAKPDRLGQRFGANAA